MSFLIQTKGLIRYIFNDYIYTPLKIVFYFWYPTIRFIMTMLYLWFFFNLLISMLIFFFM